MPGPVPKFLNPSVEVQSVDVCMHACMHACMQRPLRCLINSCLDADPHVFPHSMRVKPHDHVSFSEHSLGFIFLIEGLHSNMNGFLPPQGPTCEAKTVGVIRGVIT